VSDDGERPRDVHVLELDDREIVLVGTAHISRESAELVREVIAKERPDCVCLELDARRYEALCEKRQFEALDLVEVIRRKQLATLFANLLLGAYQKRLGGRLGVVPGAEMVEAARAAEERGIPIALCDRDVRITLRRAWRSMSLWRKSRLFAELVVASFEKPSLSEEMLREIREGDVVSELLRELGEALPELKTALIDERDAWLAHKIRQAPGPRIVAVVGAGHVRGILAALRRPPEVDLAELGRIPPAGRAVKIVGWGVPAAILGALAWIGLSQGAAAARDNLVFWIVANGVPTTLGALLAAAHPVAIACAFFVSPVTSLIPVIGAGYVLAFLQAWLAPPTVREFQTVGEDATRPARWWRNRLLKVLLVFLFTTLGSIVGTWVGGLEIASNVF